MKKADRIARAKRLVTKMDKREKKLDAAMARWKVAKSALSKEDRAVDKLENEIEDIQFEIEELIGGPYYGQKL